MILANKGIIPPNEWLHDPMLQDIFGMTVGMILAVKKIIPPKEWYHDPSL